MELQTDNIPKIYFRYLVPSLFSGLVMSIYSLVDMIVVGQYEGAAGTAALACVSPLWAFFLLSLHFVWKWRGGLVQQGQRRRPGKRKPPGFYGLISYDRLHECSCLVCDRCV